MFCTNRVPRRSKLSSRPAKRGTGHRWPPAAVAQRTRRQASLCLRSRTVEGARAATLAPPVQEEPPHAPSTALRGGKIRSFSRRARVRALPTTTTPFPHRDSAPRKKGGSGAPKGACQPSPPADTGALCAARPLSGGSALLRVAFRRSAAALARANASAIGSAPVPAFPETRPGGRYPFRPVTSLPRSAETGRYAGRAVAPSRPGAERISSARRHRTRSVFRKCPRERRPSLSEIRPGM